MVNKLISPATSEISEVTIESGEKSFDELKLSLDQICLEVASKFSLQNSKHQPRKAAIVDCIANTTCIGCIAKELSLKSPNQHIDAIYLECHRFAVGTLIEELHSQFSRMGYSVLIQSEAETKYGKVDVLIKPTSYGVQLTYGTNEIIVEVKTGTSMSFSQIFRYLLDKENQRLILWRIRNRQILVFDGEYLKPILIRFLKTCIARGERLLKNEKAHCEHSAESNYWSPTEQSVQNMLEDFSNALVETLPLVADKILETLSLKSKKDEARNKNDFRIP